MFNWMPFLTYAATTSITPGPNNIMAMSGASRLGFRRNLPFSFGVFVGFVIVGALSTAAMSALTAFMPMIMTPMLWIGAAYLMYLAYRTYASDPHIEEKQTHGGFWTAVALQFINPKLYLCCIMSMEMFILPHFNGQPLALLGFVALMAFMAFVCTLLWACFGSAFARLLARRAKLINAVMALLLVYCAVSLFLE